MAELNEESLGDDNCVTPVILNMDKNVASESFDVCMDDVPMECVLGPLRLVLASVWIPSASPVIFGVWVPVVLGLMAIYLGVSIALYGVGDPPDTRDVASLTIIGTTLACHPITMYLAGVHFVDFIQLAYIAGLDVPKAATFSKKLFAVVTAGTIVCTFVTTVPTLLIEPEHLDPKNSRVALVVVHIVVSLPYFVIVLGHFALQIFVVHIVRSLMDECRLVAESGAPVAVFFAKYRKVQVAGDAGSVLSQGAMVTPLIGMWLYNVMLLIDVLQKARVSTEEFHATLGASLPLMFVFGAMYLANIYYVSCLSADHEILYESILLKYGDQSWGGDDSHRLIFYVKERPVSMWFLGVRITRPLVGKAAYAMLTAVGILVREFFAS